MASTLSKAKPGLSFAFSYGLAGGPAQVHMMIYGNILNDMCL